ncbi:Beta-1,3-galactosyltransferase 1 [Toxocara canis]|uniref:Hexosyltransferase n=1 Tax=Toxocara canis TaxID=6265 RepID=A0A0B2VU71_TOXCA|nr:Beta-1,3-galactosyltransferase 1 [Toxocara canis]
METRGRNELQLANFNNPDNKEVSKVLHLAVFQQWKLDDCGRPREKHNAMVIERNAFNWTIVNKHFCTKRYPNLKMLIVVLSAVENFETRKIYREMYGDHFYKERGVVTLFVVGRSLNNSINEKILEENYAHHDIIQQNFLDAYKNLTLKGLAWLQFVVDYCSNVQYVMKTDDDVVFNLYGLVDYLRIHFSNSSRIDDENRFICGMMHNLTAPRDPSKWCVTRDEYKFDEFPPYCMGLQYIITPRIAAKLLEASVGEKFIWIEDYFFTGQIGQKINAKYHDISALRGQKEQFLNMTALFWLAHETHMAEGKEAWRNTLIAAIEKYC